MKINVGECTQLTDRRWINLFSVPFDIGDGQQRTWDFASRKRHPFQSAGELIPDAVVIVPYWKQHVAAKGSTANSGSDPAEEYKLILIREFRIPINDYELAFPAGLFEPGEDFAEVARRELKEETGLDLVRLLHVSPTLVSSAGLSDESFVMVFVECTGEISTTGAEGSEDITVVPAGAREIAELLHTRSPISAKTWPLLWMHAALGKVEPVSIAGLP